MASFTMEEIIHATGGTVLCATPRARVRGVTTDSRQVKRGDLFVALKGPHVDGHRFVKGAIADGAVGVMISETAWASISSWIHRRQRTYASASLCVIGVDDSLKAYQDLASYHRCRFSIPLIALTGSNGKTTAKEMVSHVLATRWRTMKTHGNFNNRIGVPHTLLRMTHRYKAAVIEMGVDQEGQTTRLCEIARPTVGVITNVGPDHLEFFGTIDASARAKGELLPALPSDGVAVLNADDAYYKDFTRQVRCRMLSFGFSPRAEVRASNVVLNRQGAQFRLHLPHRTRTTHVQLRMAGQHNVSNALAGAAVGHALGVAANDIAVGLGTMRAASMRSQIHRVGGVTFVYDCYNANPASMEAGVDLLVDLARGNRTIAVLGEMRELGVGEASFHEEVGRYVAKKDIAYLIVCGKLGTMLADGARKEGMPASAIFDVKQVSDAATVLQGLVRRGDVVLLKASRGVQMEHVLDFVARTKKR
ncbi:MAG: UDP-N-acetylmuramoyl-tripeptide--D-alanyl-D-alanine ligase [Nitrospirales bacterium]|nr:MAG: UDP-N-acetylmuramoyl-tripeptide--D-alanyl-D-alanine ligase [Nitrospirales bacterium]